ncbi:hypothetical protein [Macrococcoides caseolyticum]|uniref:hypothetical protein n=1 Tax=Macrococcoides caseolyticum TaxID=69966 RepID=UPI001E3AC36C|nr:hypothetical protein [Macrococcus caseolyticus]
MIKTGDKLHHQGKEWNVEFAGEPFVHLKHGDDFIIESSHIFWNKLYVEQKQRADELAELYVQLEKESESLSISLCERIERYHERTTKLIQEKSKAVERADELEKRWSELVDVLKKKYEYYKVRADDESAGPIEQGKWKDAKHELMMVLKIMTDLKRGETE